MHRYNTTGEEPQETEEDELESGVGGDPRGGRGGLGVTEDTLYGDLPIPSCSGLCSPLADTSLGQAGSCGGQMEHIGSCLSDQKLRGSTWEDQEGLSDSLQQQNCLARHSVGDGGTRVKTKLGACQVCVV